jgi:pentatricopeptide repeat protein
MALYDIVIKPLMKWEITEKMKKFFNQLYRKGFEPSHPEKINIFWWIY